ncbi:MAG: membrane protein insertase YidC, partial [Methylibium sp.]
MTDMRRTLLWVVFTMSLVLLWDAWNKHTGQPSMFAPAPRPVAAASAPGVTPPASSVLPSATAVAPAAGSGAPPALVAPPATAPTVTVSTDVLKLTLDARGGDVVHAELLTQVDQNDRTRNVVLFDRSKERVYLAQTGLVGAPDLPNHLTAYTLVPGETSLAAGKDALEVVFESPEQGGVKLRKTLTLQRGNYAVQVRHDVVNTGTAALSPQLYVQLVRDGNAPPGESSFYSTFTGPVVYTDASKFHKVDFKSIEKGNTEHDKTADNGWVAMVQH